MVFAASDCAEGVLVVAALQETRREIERSTERGALREQPAAAAESSAAALALAARAAGARVDRGDGGMALPQQLLR